MYGLAGSKCLGSIIIITLENGCTNVQLGYIGFVTFLPAFVRDTVYRIRTMLNHLANWKIIEEVNGCPGDSFARVLFLLLSQSQLCHRKHESMNQKNPLAAWFIPFLSLTPLSVSQFIYCLL